MASAGQAHGADLLDSLARRFPGVLYRCSADEHWTMGYLSPGIEALSGYPPEDFIGNRVRSYASLIHPEDREKVDREVDVAVSKGQPFDIEYRPSMPPAECAGCRSAGTRCWTRAGGRNGSTA